MKPLETEMTAQFVPAHHVRSAVHGDRTVLLDLRRERYYSLDEVGTRVWEMMHGGANVQSIITQLSEEYDAPKERIASDVSTLLRRLANDLKVVDVVETSPKEPSGIRCATTLGMMTAYLRMFGLRRSLVLAERLARRTHRAVDPSPEFLASIVRKIDTAAAFFPGRALCLEQSLALYVCLRQAGVDVILRIGAQPYPFAAHAWVEYQGEPVGSSYDVVGKFVAFDHLTGNL